VHGKCVVGEKVIRGVVTIQILESHGNHQKNFDSMNKK
jgi:hypothetical protein